MFRNKRRIYECISSGVYVVTIDKQRRVDMNVGCHLCSYTERMVEVRFGSRLLSHKRLLAVLPEQGSAARNALVLMDVLPRACSATSAALLSRSWRC